MELEVTHGSCCGHRAIGSVYDINLKTGKVQDEFDRSVDLKTFIAGSSWRGLVCKTFSWIANDGQYKESAKLKSEFEKLKFTVRTANFGRNPKSGNLYHMRIAIKR